MFTLQLPLTTRPKPANSHALCLSHMPGDYRHHSHSSRTIILSDSHIQTILFLFMINKKFNSISLKYSKKACNVDCVSEVYQNTLKLLLSDCILIVGTRHELHIGAMEMLKGSWNIFEKILSSGQMYLENCQKFLGCFGNLAVIQKSLTLVSEKIGRYIPALGQRRMGGHPVLGRH